MTTTQTTTRRLYDADTNDDLGIATAEQVAASDRDAEITGTGIIAIDEDGHVAQSGRRVYVEAG